MSGQLIGCPDTCGTSGGLPPWILRSRETWVRSTGTAVVTGSLPHTAWMISATVNTAPALRRQRRRHHTLLRRAEDQLLLAPPYQG